MNYKSRQVRGMVKHSQHLGSIVPVWMLCWHTLDSLCWAPLFRAHILAERKRKDGAA